MLYSLWENNFKKYFLNHKLDDHLLVIVHFVVVDFAVDLVFAALGVVVAGMISILVALVVLEASVTKIILPVLRLDNVF